MLNNFDFDKESPFEPGKPVHPDLFIGRQNTVQKILRNTRKSLNGNTQHFFLMGKRRMGKTSVAEYVKKYMKLNFKMLGACISNKGNESVEYLTTQIIESLFNELSHDSLKDKVANWFGEHIESVEIKGNKITFAPDKSLSVSFKDNFIYYLKKFYEEELCGEYKGVLIVIDDINGLSNSREFVDWYKNFADTLSVTREKLPFYFLLAGYPEKFDCLVQQEESFGSIFHQDYIGKLTNEEVEEFFNKMFNQQGIEISQSALSLMVQFSSGLPLMMQQIGESLFWLVDDNN